MCIADKFNPSQNAHKMQKNKKIKIKKWGSKFCSQDSSGNVDITKLSNFFIADISENGYMLTSFVNL